jgi:hypothetical protein
MADRNAAGPATKKVSEPRGYCQRPSCKPLHSTSPTEATRHSALPLAGRVKSPELGGGHIPDVRLRQLTSCIYSLRPRPLHELFLELERGLDLRDALERYACISHYSAFIAANGGARLPPVIGGLMGP